PGIFTFAGAAGIPTMPASTGLAGLIRVSDAVDPAKGGTFEAIRDGGINGTDYVYNPNGNANAAFSGRLYALTSGMVAERPFDPAFGFGPTASLQGFASLTGSWHETTRQSASQNVDYQTTLLSHASEALSNATDVNMDDETALMQQLEKSYAASAKLLSDIDQMLKTLLSVVG
ncbi:flagellar basal body rod C-terminal domain-containing protein, partial [Vibrio parahaemolyticus]|nr:flagellar basal body rod C-terminal domain-containing protein [Vibrio parahaemolyticus]